MYWLLIPFGGILLGGLLGTLLSRRIDEDVSHALQNALGLCALIIGLRYALRTEDTLCMLLSICLGTLAGKALGLEGHMERLGGRVERLLVRGNGTGAFTKAFVTTSVFFVGGVTPILGPIAVATTGEIDLTVTEGILDGITAVMFASSMGIGVALSAFVLLGFESLVFLLADVINPILSDAVLREMAAVGGLIIIGAGLNMLLPDSKIKIINMLPAMLLAVIYRLLLGGII